MSDIHKEKVLICGSNKFTLIFTIMTSIVFIVLGIFSLVLVNILDLNAGTTAEFYSNINLFRTNPMFIGYGLIFLGVVAAIMVLREKSITTYTIFENGISCRCKGKEDFVHFKDISDVYLFSIGKSSYRGVINCLAYRKNRGDAWLLISPRVSKSGRLISVFRELYPPQRSKELCVQLEQGDMLEFNYLESKKVWFKRLFAFDAVGAVNIDSSLRQFNLTKNSIIKDGKNIAVDKSDKLDVSSLSGRLSIIDRGGNKKFSIMFQSVVSADVFRILLQGIIECEKN